MTSASQDEPAAYEIEARGRPRTLPLSICQSRSGAVLRLPSNYDVKPVLCTMAAQALKKRPQIAGTAIGGSGET